MNKEMHCLICNSEVQNLMCDMIMGKHRINYFFCKKCKCVFTEEPYWLNEAYSDSIAFYDTGRMSRNISNCNNLMLIFNRNFNSNMQVVDYGGGYGILTRMLRDKGVDALWYDKFSDNLLAKGFEYNGTDNVDVIVAFEVLEHLPNPLEIIKEIMSKTDCFIFSTVLLERFDYTTNNDWWYFVPEGGQHIFFYSEITMIKISELLKCRYEYINGLHILHRLDQFYIDFSYNRISNLLSRILNKINSYLTPNNKFKSKTWEDHIFIKSKNNNI